MAAVTDLRDTRVLIPRVRRALDGPHATGSGAVANTLSDDEVNAIVADAIADVILNTGGFFGKKLEVVARDEAYLAPIAWQTSAELTLDEQSVIAAQAAIGYFLNDLSATLKTSETIRDEGREWTYSLSANLLRDRLNALMKLRDAALESLSHTAALDSWVNLLHERDQIATAYIEPFAEGGFAGGGMELWDARFGWELVP